MGRTPWAACGLLLPGQAQAAVSLDAELSLWNLGLALLTLVAAAVAFKHRVAALEERQESQRRRLEEEAEAQGAVNAEFREKIHQNEKKLLKQERQVLERLLRQEQLLFARLDERLNRFEDRMDLIVKSLAESRGPSPLKER